MSNPLPELQQVLLEKLLLAPGKRLGGAKIAPSMNQRKSLALGKADVAEALNRLTEQGLVAVSRSGKGHTYRLTREGESCLEDLASEPVVSNQKLFGYQKAFVLLKFFQSSGRSMTQTQLEQRLRSAEPVATLGFGDMEEGPDGKPRPVVNTRLVGTILRGLLQQRALERKGARFELTEHGEELLGASEQYPTFELRLTVTGRQFNQLREAIRRGLGIVPAPVAGGEGQAALALVADAPPRHAAPAPELTASAVLGLAEELRRGQYERTGLVPIWDLRRQVAARLGEEAASHASLDPLLRHLRRQDRVRLVSIGDRSSATPEQLDGSVPGENETFFYLEVAREYAALG